MKHSSGNRPGRSRDEIGIFTIRNLANKKAREADHVAGSSLPLDRPGERPGSTEQ
jgi:hypothetical protein